jgi:hypothetical protein
MSSLNQLTPDGLKFGRLMPSSSSILTEEFLIQEMVRMPTYSQLERMDRFISNGRSSMLKTCQLNPRRESLTKITASLLKDHSTLLLKWNQEDSCKPNQIMLCLRQEMEDVNSYSGSTKEHSPSRVLGITEFQWEKTEDT